MSSVYPCRYGGPAFGRRSISMLHQRFVSWSACPVFLTLFLLFLPQTSRAAEKASGKARVPSEREIAQRIDQALLQRTTKRCRSRRLPTMKRSCAGSASI